MSNFDVEANREDWTNNIRIDVKASFPDKERIDLKTVRNRLKEMMDSVYEEFIEAYTKEESSL